MILRSPAGDAVTEGALVRGRVQKYALLQGARQGGGRRTTRSGTSQSGSARRAPRMGRAGLRPPYPRRSGAGKPQARATDLPQDGHDPAARGQEGRRRVRTSQGGSDEALWGVGDRHHVHARGPAMGLPTHRAGRLHARMGRLLPRYGSRRGRGCRGAAWRPAQASGCRPGGARHADRPRKPAYLQRVQPGHKIPEPQARVCPVQDAAAERAPLVPPREAEDRVRVARGSGILPGGRGDHTRSVCRLQHAAASLFDRMHAAGRACSQVEQRA